LNHADKQAPVALITGAGRRIGASIADFLQQKGYRVIVHYNQSERAAQSLVSRLNKIKPDSAKLLSANLTDKNNVNTLIMDALEWGDRLDALVNNASIFKKTEFHQINDQDWDDLFNTNVKAPLWLSHACYPYLAKSNGAIINITDIHADKPLKNYAVYCQSKAALNMQTKALALEFAPHVRVNAVAPGAIIWPEDENILSKNQKDKIITKTPLQVHGQPIYIAQGVLTLLENPFITGQILRVDGGRSIV